MISYFWNYHDDIIVLNLWCLYFVISQTHDIMDNIICKIIYQVEISRNGQINGFARASEILISFVNWFSWKFRSWMVLFVLDQCVSSFSHANARSIFEFDADWFIDFSTRILITWLNGLDKFFLSLIYKNPGSRFMLELMVIFVLI